MLQIEDLQVKVGDKEILKHIDLEIQEGETHILFGTFFAITLVGNNNYST